jgi:origin recognition complex subunit 3
MCHFYENALSFLTSGRTALTALKYLQPVHYRAIRVLPSYRQLIQGLIDSGELSRAKSLLDEDDAVLLEETKAALASRTSDITQLLRVMHLLSSALTEPASQIELYMSIFDGKLSESVFVRAVLVSIKRMTPEELVRFLQKMLEAVQTGSSAMELDGWADHDPELIKAIAGLSKQISELEAGASKLGLPVRSSYAIHSKGLRTTVIAQRVQLSYESSTLSEQDKEFTVLVDRLYELLVNYFTLQNPQDMFLNEVWLYDSVKQHRAVFQPRPRAAIERALSVPYDYINCVCCDPVEGLSSTHPATAILYQMYLETGSLINAFDLWSAFFEMVSGGEEQKMNERDALVLFYRALADVKSLGMVKQSKKKADHLAKLAWKGL